MEGQGGPNGPESVRTARDFGPLGADSDGVWLVLGGGGLKGMALIGAYRALEEIGLRPAGVIGTSIGALIGASIAAGMTAAEMTEVALAVERKDIARLNPFFYMIDGFRYGFIGHADASVLTGVLVMAGINLFLLLVVYRMLKTGYRLKA